MLPAFDKQQIGNALGWGIVDDTPNSFVWEIGHTSPYTKPADQFCVPESVTFADGSTAKEWAAVSDFGGAAEVNQYCTARRASSRSRPGAAGRSGLTPPTATQS